MRHAASGRAGVRQRRAIAEHCTDALGHALERSLLMAAARAERAVEKPRLARKNVHQAALEELCKHARMLHSQSTEQHVEEQRVFTLRQLPADANAACLREYEARAGQMAADIRAAAMQAQEELYDPVELLLPENSLRTVCDLLRTRPGELIGPEDHVLLQEFGHSAREHLDKLLLGALAMHCEVLAANIACNARAVAAPEWGDCMQQAWQQAAAGEVNQRRLASPNVQQLQALVCTLEGELHAESAHHAGRGKSHC
jgi:hypothetical protein